MAAFKTMSRKNRDNRLRRRLLIAGLAAFLIFDVALVAFALTDSKPPANAGAVVEPVETNPAVVEPVGTNPPVVAPVETAPAAVETQAPNRILAALDASTAWRATTGACPAATANPELTTDDGATWNGFDASAGTDASSVLAIDITSKSQVSLVTLKASDCTPQRVTTYVAGDAWQEYPDRVAANWYVDPANRAVVHSPAGSFPASCPTVIALAPRSDTVGAALCSNGTLLRTGDGGATWGPGSALPGAANINVSADGYIVVAANQPGCAGAQVFSTTEALDGALTPGGCREGAFNPGDVAVASADGIVWLCAGDVVSRSSDGGATWQ